MGPGWNFSCNLNVEYGFVDVHVSTFALSLGTERFQGDVSVKATSEGNAQFSKTFV